MNERVYKGVLLRQVPKHPNYYASRCGMHVVSFKRRTPVELVQMMNECGYLKVTVDRTKRFVHRMVAWAWLGDDMDLTVNHIDANKLNNAASNLEWCSITDNHLHAMSLGIHSNPEKPIIGINPVTGNGIWIKSLRHADELGHFQQMIALCLSGKRKHHHGYQWMHDESAQRGE